MANRRIVIEMSRSKKNPPQTVAAAAPDAAQRLEQSRQFAIEAARLAAQTHCQNVTVLDVAGLSPVTDFFVIATGTSPRQMRSVCDEIEELGQQRHFRSLSRSGYNGEQWICVDFVDVLLHVFSGEARQYYDLDNLWGDAKPVAWSESAVKTSRST
jgi:ribosome-associated protein